MSTLNGPIWSRCIIALTCPARSHFQRTHSKERRAGVGMNVFDHQEKKKNEETKKGRREEKVKTSDRFCRCCVLPFCGRSGGSIAKK